MSGGDLDGDMYFVCWDEDLLPHFEMPPAPSTASKSFKLQNAKPKPIVSKGEEYLEISPTQIFVENINKEMVEFFLKYQSENDLGLISKAHEILCDSKGASDEQAIELSQLACKAVVNFSELFIFIIFLLLFSFFIVVLKILQDAAKSGDLQKLPMEYRDLFRNQPDWMKIKFNEDHDLQIHSVTNTYNSTSVIGNFTMVLPKLIFIRKNM